MDESAAINPLPNGANHLDGEPKEDLPTHTLYMRHAFEHCVQMQDAWQSQPRAKPFWLDTSQREAASALAEKRQESCQSFWENDSSVLQMEIVDYATIHAPHHFRKKFLYQNLPCLVQGLAADNKGAGSSNSQSCFHSILQKWRHPDTGKINPEWFLQHVGEETLVPLRYQKQELDKNSTALNLDEEGRAEECETRNVSLKQWVDMLRNDKSSEKQPLSSLYLKDWHLVSVLQDKNSNQLPLYHCPAIFDHDLLNSFQTTFCNGDYKFCYWGPPGSITARHSDVLHSFSWSFNVVGTKVWTFFSPFDHATSFQVVQHAGECMFVPCQWQHEVLNLEETLSINHNWITTANIDQTWNCLTSEMRAVDKELDDWGIPRDAFESQEAMLRGCVGLDVTAFFFMILTSLWYLLLSTPGDTDFTEMSFDIYRLVDALDKLVQGSEVNLKERLGTVLASRAFGKEAWTMAKILIKSVNGAGIT
jgi:hypothetical protein